jgi:hypothetical protein
MDLIILGAIVVGLVAMLKIAFGINPRYVPLIALATSFVLIGIYCLAKLQIPSWELIQNGFIIALTSVGLYSGVKNTAGK